MHLSSSALNTTNAVTIIILSLLLLMACKTTDFNPQTYAGDYITIGEGGGFSGIETRYHILIDGHVFKQSGIDTIQTKLPSVEAKAVRQSISTYKDLALDQYSFREPGNIYKFMTFQVNGQKNRLVWNDQEKIRRECVQIYNILYDLIQKDKK